MTEPAAPGVEETIFAVLHGVAVGQLSPVNSVERIMEAFAPILAEKELEIRELDERATGYWQTIEKDVFMGSSREKALEARALAAEAERDAALLASRHEADLCEQALSDLKAAEAALAGERERAADIADMAAEREDARAFERDDDLHVAECRGAERAARAIAAAIRAQGK